MASLTNDQKTAFLVFSTSIVFFFLFVRTRIKAPGTSTKNEDTADASGKVEDIAARKPIAKPTIDKKKIKSQLVLDAYNSLCAYISAYNAGETQDDLNQMVKDMRRRYSVRVYKRSDGRWAVADTAGKDIIINELS